MRGCSADGAFLSRARRFGPAAGLAALIFTGVPSSRAEQARSAESATSIGNTARVPLPPPRPRDPNGSGDASPNGSLTQAPVPPPRPTLNDLPPAASASAESTEAPAEETACRERLKQLGVSFEALPSIVNGACSAPWPVRISALPDGLALAQPVTVTCPVAEALTRWVLEAVAPAAKRDLETRLTRIATGTSYECRSRNRQEGAKLSEHAFANAIDVAGFTFESGKVLQVGPLAPETPEGRFQAAIRAEACRSFATVLGPGSDASHEDHLHLDLRARKQGFHLCQ